jgi:hypothetical protein
MTTVKRTEDLPLPTVKIVADSLPADIQVRIGHTLRLPRARRARYGLRSGLHLRRFGDGTGHVMNTADLFARFTTADGLGRCE